MEDEADLTSEPSPHCKSKYFLDLPAEIRIMIYGLVLCYDEAIEPNMLLVLPGVLLRKWFNPDISLLHVNKQVSLEASQIFYRSNAWLFDSMRNNDVKNDDPRVVDGSRALRWLRQIGGNVNYIQEIHYLCEPETKLEFRMVEFELTAIRLLLPNLRRMTFISQNYD
ncbi:hypothetical protein VTJ04DRAFT_10362 [Mycothermus thermophilus]|uniref:uncharacterized protein n=1 Tax=Humicola insolens TaxID=85995 RepID=UPI00374473D6